MDTAGCKAEAKNEKKTSVRWRAAQKETKLTGPSLLASMKWRKSSAIAQTLGSSDQGDRPWLRRSTEKNCRGPAQRKWTACCMRMMVPVAPTTVGGQLASRRGKLE